MNKTPERKLATNRAWRAKNLEKARANCRKWHSKNSSTQKLYKLRRSYGENAPEHLIQQLSKQNNLCAICANPFVSSRDTHLDHNHTTGQLRGALCSHCNVGIGNLNDDVELLKKAIQYLDGWNNVID